MGMKETLYTSTGSISKANYQVFNGYKWVTPKQSLPNDSSVWRIGWKSTALWLISGNRVAAFDKVGVKKLRKLR